MIKIVFYSFKLSFSYNCLDCLSSMNQKNKPRKKKNWIVNQSYFKKIILILELSLKLFSFFGGF